MLTRQQLLTALHQHHRLTAEELLAPALLGFAPDRHQLKFLLRQLVISGQIQVVVGTSPQAYAPLAASVSAKKADTGLPFPAAKE